MDTSSPLRDVQVGEWIRRGCQITENNPVTGSSKKSYVKRMSKIASYVYYVNCEKVKQLDYGWVGCKDGWVDVCGRVTHAPKLLRHCNR